MITKKTKAGIAFMLLSIASFSQTGYVQKTLNLPMSTEAKSYYVKQIGTNYVLNGDIIVGTTLQQLAIYQSNNSNGAFIWPKGNVPVVIDPNMKTNRTIYGTMPLLYDNALEAVKVLNNNTHIRLAPHINEKDYIRIKYTSDTGYGGISPIGKRGGEQIIYITRQSDIKTIVHELLHSLGFWHEQSRYDRDNHVVIDMTNIAEEYKYNFQIEPGSPTSAYDYESIMHYPADAFAKDKSKPSIQCKKGNNISNCSFGSRYIFSEKDITGINTSYWYNNNVAKVDYKGLLELRNPPVEKIVGGVKGGFIRVKDQSQQPPTDGIYKIKINQTGKYLAVEGISTANGARLVQWDYVEQDNHKFKVLKNAAGHYEIISLHINKHISMAGGGKADGTQIFQWDCNGDDYCKWTIYYSTQQPNPGWVIQGKNASPIQMTGGITDNANGQTFILKQQQRHDAHDYDALQTFTFEKIGNLNSFQTEKLKRNGGLIKPVQKVKGN
jgi:Astacin (Peptidase family M12A)/Ricin-type beta-trefoil lectin domain-like